MSAKRSREQLLQLTGDMIADKEKEESDDEETRKCREAVEAHDAAEKKAKMETAENEKMETAENEKMETVEETAEGDANLPDLLPTLTMAEIINSFPRFADDGSFLRIDTKAKILYVEDLDGKSQTFDFSTHYVL